MKTETKTENLYEIIVFCCGSFCRECRGRKAVAKKTIYIKATSKRKAGNLASKMTGEDLRFGQEYRTCSVTEYIQAT